MKIIFWGTPEYSIKTLQKLISSNHDVLAVVTQPDKKRSRGNKLIPSPIKEFSISNEIQVLCPEVIKNNIDFISSLKKFNCDLFIVIAYGKILSREILEIPKYGSWNAHASLLPRWRGAAPIQWALLKGDKSTGVGIMKMEEGLDTGDILIEKEIHIFREDNLKSLSLKLSELSANLFLDAMEIISSKENIEDVTLTPQTRKCREIKYARMIKKSDFILNFKNTADDIFRKVNGLYPQANLLFRNKNLKITKIRILESDETNQLIRENSIDNYFFSSKKPNLIIGTIKNEGVIISTKSQPIIILEIKLEGKNLASKNQLIQQLNPKIGENFI